MGIAAVLGILGLVVGPIYARFFIVNEAAPRSWSPFPGTGRTKPLETL
jgi:hypothetical protein